MRCRDVRFTLLSYGVVKELDEVVQLSDQVPGVGRHRAGVGVGRQAVAELVAGGVGVSSRRPPARPTARRRRGRTGRAVETSVWSPPLGRVPSVHEAREFGAEEGEEAACLVEPGAGLAVRAQEPGALF